MISIREEITIASPPEAVWPFLSDPAVVASCIPGATLTKAGAKGAYQGTMRVKFGPTVAQFRGEAKLTYDHAARRGAARPRKRNEVRRSRQPGKSLRSRVNFRSLARSVSVIDRSR
jgi:hypothetical protein